MPLNFVALFAFEAFSIGRIHIKMGPFEFVILLIAIDDVRNRRLLIEAALVNGVLGEVRLDDMQLAQMTPAITLAAYTTLLVMVREVRI